jgi:MscS family membrane protein
VQVASGRMVPVRLAREARAGDVRWVFSAATVALVDSMFRALPDHWVREHLPAALRRTGPFGIQWWQWLALLTLLPLAAIVGTLLAGPVQALLKRLVSRTETELDDALVHSARGPIVLLIGVATSRLLLYWIVLPAAGEQFVVDLQRAIAVVAVFWILLRVIGVLQQALPSTDWGSSHPALRSLIPLVGRVARLLVLIIGLLTVIASFGYPIATILAGLGIGGIAVALGAQKSLEHFFGSVSIGVDQPFGVGDWVIVDGVEGEVEAIGLRSTRIRTLERTVVSIPNGRLAESRSENFGPRDRIRMRTMIGLEYGTTAAQVERVRDRIEAMLRSHPSTWPGRVVVGFTQFSPSSIDLEIFCWVMTTDVDEFRRIRQEHYLGIMRVVEEAGARFAYPTQTVNLRNMMKVEG